MIELVAGDFPAAAQRQDDRLTVDLVALDRHGPAGGQKDDLGARVGGPQPSRRDATGQADEDSMLHAEQAHTTITRLRLCPESLQSSFCGHDRLGGVIGSAADLSGLDERVKDPDAELAGVRRRRVRTS